MKKEGIVEVSFGTNQNGSEGIWLKLNAPVPFKWEKVGDRYFLDLSKRAKNSATLEEARKKHANAYMPWTPEDDDRLECLFADGTGVKQLCEIFGRNRGAIQSRIKKLGLKEIYL